MDASNQAAATDYQRYQADIRRLIEMLQRELSDHANRGQTRARVAEIAHVRNGLVDVVASVFDTSHAEVEAFL
jgi:hypothetical protein